MLIATGAATEPELQATDIHVFLKFPPQSSEFQRVSFSLFMAYLVQLIIYFPPMLYFTAFRVPYTVNNFFSLYALLFLSFITQLIYIFSHMLYITAFPDTLNNLFPVMLYFTAFSYTVNNLFPVGFTLLHSLIQ